jgi:folate-dependent tRNA-U54 methylase TrmFO/GidA
MKTRRLAAVLIFVSVAATASALVLAFRQDIILATVLGCGGYVSTAATGLVIGAR